MQRPRDRAADAARSAGDQRVLPVRSNIMCSFDERRDMSAGTALQRLDEGFDVGRALMRALPVSSGRCACTRPAQHLAGADLDQPRDALLLHEQHAFAPAHHAR